MDTQKAFEAALSHYRKGNELLNFQVAKLMEEQALHIGRAAAHFGAGNLALALARAQLDGIGAEVSPADDEDDAKQA
jgi:hypothetical protein